MFGSWRRELIHVLEDILYLLLSYWFAFPIHLSKLCSEMLAQGCSSGPRLSTTYLFNSVSNGIWGEMLIVVEGKGAPSFLFVACIYQHHSNMVHKFLSVLPPPASSALLEVPVIFRQSTCSLSESCFRGLIFSLASSWKPSLLPLFPQLWIDRSFCSYSSGYFFCFFFFPVL